MQVRAARSEDVGAMVALSAVKRAAYAQVQPGFWRGAPDADRAQTEHFRGLLGRKGWIALVAEDAAGIVGFLLGEVRAAPPVYEPGGFTCLVDDFCVRDGSRWADAGATLLEALRREAAAQGAVQVVVVCGEHDAPKHALLRAAGLTVASAWYVGPARAS